MAMNAMVDAIALSRVKSSLSALSTTSAVSTSA